MSAYAEKIAKTQQYVSQLVAAAEVAKSTTRVVDLSDKAKHLLAIHALSSSLWPGMVEAMLAGQLANPATTTNQQPLMRIEQPEGRGLCRMAIYQGLVDAPASPRD